MLARDAPDLTMPKSANAAAVATKAKFCRFAFVVVRSRVAIFAQITATLANFRHLNREFHEMLKSGIY
jgi:hypothetical protein